MEFENSRWLVIGLGNPILGDDGVGWRVAEEVRRRLRMADDGWRNAEHAADSQIPNPKSEIEVDCASLGGLSLMERMIGYARVVLIDAISTGQHPVGDVRRFPLQALPDPAAGHSASAHDATLPIALKLGRAMGARLPREIVVVAVECRSDYAFGEELTGAVAAAVPVAADLVVETLSSWRQAQGAALEV